MTPPPTTQDDGRAKLPLCRNPQAANGSAGASPSHTHRRIRLWAEMLLIFVGSPILLTLIPNSLGDLRLFMILWAGGLACGLYLFNTPAFNRDKLWNARALWPLPGWMVLRGVVLCAAVMLGFGLFAGREVLGLRFPAGLFTLVDRMPILWLAIMLCYPWISVYPQNIIYRAFFCQRYAPLLGTGWLMIIVNALLFALGHMMFGNWVVLLLTAVGGAIFTRTYLRSGSLLLATLEHAAYGLFCFSVGIGWFLLYQGTGS